METKKTAEEQAEIEKIKKRYSDFSKEIDRCLTTEPKTANKILALKEKYDLTDEQMKKIIKNAISMANNFRKENEEKNK